MKFNLTSKRLSVVAVFTALSCISLQIQAQESAEIKMTSKTCPDTFYSLPLFPNPKMCQVFAPQLPASLTYHAPTDQQSTQNFYIEKLGKAEQVKSLKGRILMEYDGANKIIILSIDGAGTQVDVLVKS